MSLKVFISYKHEDSIFAKELHSRLVDWGHLPWLDIVDIQPGTKWDDAIHNGLKVSQIVIGVLTLEALKSPNVLDEWGWALENKRRLFLLWYGDVSPEDIPPRYIRIQRIDIRNNEANGFAQLKNALVSPTAIIHDRLVTIALPSLIAEAKVELSTNSYRLGLLNLVEKNWLHGVLYKILETGRFDLGIKMASPHSVLRHHDYGDYELPPDSNILDIFIDMKGTLLILGEPGAGKTVLLLQLAQALVIEARSDQMKPIPTVFNLSAWAIERKAFLDWIIDDLVQRYKIKKEIAVNLIENRKLVLLLDGLDEVNTAYRNACVDAINDFRQSHKFLNLVVCSRTEDYEILTSKLDLMSAVALQPLRKDQIDHFLSRPDLESLRIEMQNDETLYKIAEIPFLLNTMAYAYKGISISDIQLSETKNLSKLRQNHLLNAYIQRRLLSTPSSNYTLDQTLQYLSWLAKGMAKYKQTVFRIRDLNSNWLTNQEQQQNYENAYRNASILRIGLGALAIVPMAFAGGVSAILTGITYVGMEIYSSAVSLNIDGDRLVRQLVNDIINGDAETTRSKELIKQLHNQNRNRWLDVVGVIRGEVISELINSGIPKQTSEKLIDKILLDADIPVERNPIKTLTRTIVNSRDALKRNTQSGAVLKALNQVQLAPPNYKKFLDYAVSANLLRRVGDGYIFSHRYLLEYFSENDF